MGRVRLAHDILAYLVRRPRLPRPGGAFHYQYATHVAVPSRDPLILRALLQSAYGAARSDGCHFLSICAPVGDPVDPAFRGYITTDLRAELHLVTLPGVVLPPIDASVWPGFEMALV
jgi:hypothetical protein